jgi:glycosyltransferase involved in cell wall biosynthesis
VNETQGAAARIKIAFVGLRGVPAVYGGVDRVIEEISTGLAERGHEVTVYCWKNIYRERPSEYRGVKLVYLPTIPVRYVGTLIHTLLGCLSALRRDVDIVHINNTENSIFAFIPRLGGKRVVVQPHGPAWPILKWGTLRERAFFNFKIALTRAYLHLCRFPTRWWADKIVVISGPDADYISRRKLDKFILIHNGCNIPEPLRPDKMLRLGIQPRGYILFVGRFDPRKGCHYLIEAFRGLKGDLKLVIVGGPLESTYGRFLRRLAGTDSRIAFTGPMYDATLRELFSNALVYAHPSESEGQSISLLEGLAYGNCVVTSDTPESIETAEDNAYYFKAGDPGDLRRVLESVLGDPAGMEAMRQRARRHVERAYQWPDKITQYEHLYRTLK